MTNQTIASFCKLLSKQQQLPESNVQLWRYILHTKNGFSLVTSRCFSFSTILVLTPVFGFIYTVHVFSSHQDTHQILMEKQLLKRKLFFQVEGTLWSSAMEQCLYVLFVLSKRERAAIFTFTSVVLFRAVLLYRCHLCHWLTAGGSNRYRHVDVPTKAVKNNTVSYQNCKHNFFHHLLLFWLFKNINMLLLDITLSSDHSYRASFPWSPITLSSLPKFLEEILPSSMDSSWISPSCPDVLNRTRCLE